MDRSERDEAFDTSMPVQLVHPGRPESAPDP